MSDPPDKIRQVVADWIAAGKPPQPAMPWPKQRWLEAFPDYAADLFDLPDELDRATVLDIGELAQGGPRDAVFAFLTAMAWGYGEKGYGPYRTTNVLNARPDSAERLQAIARVLVDDGAVAGYRALAGDASIPGLGLSFGTKILYFFQPAEDRLRALILDAFMTSWLAREIGWKIDTTAWSAKAYEKYIDTMDDWSIELGIDPDELEMCIFRAEAGRRGSRWGDSASNEARPPVQLAPGALPFDAYPLGGRVLLGKPKWGDGTARRSYGVKALEWCGHHCAYCGLDMSTFEGWLQLSIDHVIPQQMQGTGYASEWVLDAINVVAACNACNGYFNRDPVIGEIPTTLEAFCDLRDRVFRERQARILDRRATEREWFEANIKPAES